MKDKISVIIPIYNASNYLSTCLDCVLHQTYENLEVLLIDDGSKDNSLFICKEIEKKDNRVRVFHKENGGVSSARNLGLSKATGKYVCFIDADDEFDLELCNKLYSLISNNNCELAACDFLFNGKDNNNQTGVEELNKKTAMDGLFDFNKYNGYVVDKIYKLDIIKKNNLQFNEKVTICEDLLFNMKYFEFVNSVLYIHDKLYNYIVRSTSSYNSINEKWFTVLDAYEVINNIYKKYSDDLTLLYFSNLVINLDLKERIILSKNKTDKLNLINDNIRKYYKKVIFSKKISIKKRLKIFMRVRFNRLYIFLKRKIKGH